MLHHKEVSAAEHVPPQDAPAGLATIYSSLGQSANNLYNYIDTWLVSGPQCLIGFADFIGLPFTPLANAHVTQVRAALLYDGNGHPGKLVAGPVTVSHLANALTCCQLAVANFNSVPVAKGAQYWIVADTPKTGKGSDFVGEWAGSVTPVLMMAGNAEETGWVAFNGNGLPAGEVLGTVP
jgi:hypothetical protein